MSFQIVSNLNPVVVNMSGGFVGSITGNTDGTPAVISSGTMYLAGGNNVTLSQNGNTISINGGAGGGGGGSINLSAGTTSRNLTNFVMSNSNNVSFGLNGSTITASASYPTQTAYQFSNSNGVTFGTNGSTVTASVQTNYQSQGAYLTTARASNDALGLNTAFSNVTATANSSGLSIDARGYAGTGTTFAGTNVSASATLNSNGLNLALSAPNAGGGAGDGYNIIGVNGAGTALSTTLQFSNSNNVSFGLNAGTITASASYSQSTQPVAASASNGSFNFSTLKFVETNGVTWATSTDGIRASVKTDYQSSNANYLTSQSNQAFSASGGSSAFQTLNFANSNGITFSNSNGSVIASHNGLTTARASTDAVGLNTAQTNVTWTVNSSGISLNAGAYLTTAAQSNHSHGNPTLALTNLSGTTASASNGLTLSLSAAAGGGVNPAASASNGSFNFTTLNFSNANNVTFGTSVGGIITASVAAPGAAAENNWFELAGNTAGNSTASGSTIQLIGGANITLSGTNGSQISIVGGGGGGAGTLANWEPFQANNGTTFSSLGQNSLYLQKLLPDNNYSFQNFELRMSGSFVSSTNSQVAAHSISYGLYSKNGASYSSIATSLMVMSASFNSSTVGFTVSQGAGSYTNTSNSTNMVSLYTGFKHLYLPFTSTITAGGQYAFAINISSATTVGTQPMRMAILNQSIINNLTIGKIFATTVSGSNASFVGDFAQGVLSATTGVMPTSIAESQLTNAASQQRLYIQLD